MPPTSITEKTTVTLTVGHMWIILITVVSLASAAVLGYTATQESVQSKADLQLLKEAALREAIENPGHRVPLPDQPDKILVVTIKKD